MQNPLILKLNHGADLTDADRVFLTDLSRRTYRTRARRDIVREGQRPEFVHLVLEGFACSYKVLPDGRREIVALLVPGDICDLHVSILDAMDHSIATLSAGTMVDIPRSAILDIVDHHPRIMHALWWSAMVDQSISRQWIANLGRCTSATRMAHLSCEMLIRLQNVGLATANSYELLLTQANLGEVLGLSTVHVNRTLHELRRAELLTFEGRRMTILDVEKLQAFCNFSPNYLHLTKRRTA